MLSLFPEATLLVRPVSHRAEPQWISALLRAGQCRIWQSVLGKRGESAMYHDELENKLDRELQKMGYSYNDIVWYQRRKRLRRRVRFPLDPFVLLERLLRFNLRVLERSVARLVRAIVR